MKNMNRVMTATLIGLSALLGTPAATKAQFEGEQDLLEPCIVRGATRLAECATLSLPLDYAAPDGTQIDVHVAVLKAAGTGLQDDPIVIFAGGPGQAAGEWGVIAERAFRETMRKRDVVLMDARGTGRSTGLQCDLPTDESQFEDDAIASAIRDCRAGIDLDVRHINLETIVQDMEQVRLALGYEQLNLWGGSYGTRVVGHYLRRFPERVRSIIVDGVVPPDQRLFESAGQSAERAKNKLVEDCMNRPQCAARFPSLAEDIDALAAEALAGRLQYDGVDPMTGEPLAFTMPFTLFVESLRSVMYAADATVVLPLAIEAARAGNLQPLVANLLGGDSGMYFGMTLSVLCGEEVARITPEEALAAAEGSFARDSYYQVWAGHCANWDYFTVGKGLPSDLYEPIASDVPALILSGDLDPVTPPSLGAHWLKTFPNGRHIVVSGNGHITSSIGCMPRLIDQFVNDLDADALDASCLDHLKRLPVATGINGQVR